MHGIVQKGQAAIVDRPCVAKRVLDTRRCTYLERQLTRRISDSLGMRSVLWPPGLQPASPSAVRACSSTVASAMAGGKAKHHSRT